MLIVTYIVSVIVFCIAAWIAPLFLMPIVWSYKAITKEFIGPTHPVFVMLFVISTVLLLYCSRYAWAQFGYASGWLFPTLIAIVHLYWARAPGAKKANRAQAYGVVLGVMLYGLPRVF